MKTAMTCLLALVPCLAAAHPAHVERVAARSDGNAWTFSVTLRHAETGWDDYADGWRVVAPDGTILGTRVLAHPHVDEQPFTRSLGGVVIPTGLSAVGIEASTKAEGWSGETIRFVLPGM